MIVSIFGQPGCGKSTALRAAVATAERLLVIDTLLEHKDIVELQVIADPIQLATFLKGKERFRVGYAPQAPLPDGTRPDLDMILAWAWATGNLTIAIDEVDRYVSAGQASQRIVSLINYGRHRNLNIIATVRRPARILRDYTAASDLWLCFRTIEPRDTAYLADILGSQAAVMLPELPKYCFLLYALSDGTLKLFQTKPGGGARLLKTLVED